MTLDRRRRVQDSGRVAADPANPLRHDRQAGTVQDLGRLPLRPRDRGQAAPPHATWSRPATRSRRSRRPIRSACRELPCDAIGVGLFAHMHLRGKDMTFKAKYPDGTGRDAAAGAELQLRLAAAVPLGGRRQEAAEGHAASNAWPITTTRRSTRSTRTRRATVHDGPQTYHEMMNGFLFYVDANEKIGLRSTRRRDGEEVTVSPRAAQRAPCASARSARGETMLHVRAAPRTAPDIPASTTGSHRRCPSRPVAGVHRQLLARPSASSRSASACILCQVLLHPVERLGRVGVAVEQPASRSRTAPGRRCGYEALARWIRAQE